MLSGKKLENILTVADEFETLFFSESLDGFHCTFFKIVIFDVPSKLQIFFTGTSIVASLHY